VGSGRWNCRGPFRNPCSPVLASPWICSQLSPSHRGREVASVRQAAKRSNTLEVDGGFPCLYTEWWLEICMRNSTTQQVEIHACIYDMSECRGGGVLVRESAET
jgi:hypothetical protein